MAESCPPIYDIHSITGENLNNEEGLEDNDTSFGLRLENSGQEGGFHTTNDPTNRFQRGTVTERQGPVDIRCKSQVVIHGKLGSDSNEEATLLVYDLYLDTTKRFRRIAWAHIKFEFSSSKQNSPAPKVHNLAPFAWWSLLETSQDEHIERGTEVNLNAGYGGVSLGGIHKWSKAVDRTTTSSILLRGRTVCDSYGQETGVEFVLYENPTTKRGVPPSFRAAILLKRETEEHFECTMNIDIEADWRTEIRRLFAAKEKDDPVYFDPALPPINKLQDLKNNIDAQELESVKLDDIFETTMYTKYRNPIKEQAVKNQEVSGSTQDNC